MKKIFLSAVIVFNVLTAMAQESGSELKLYALNAGIGGFQVSDDGSSVGGIDFIVDATFSIGKNLVSATYLTGTEIGILDSSIYNFTEPSLLYGREWKIAKWFSFEGFAGLGCYIQKLDIDTVTGNDVDTETGISVPLRINSKFYFTKSFGMGFNTNYSINSVNNNLSYNLLFHYKFN